VAILPVSMEPSRFSDPENLGGRQGEGANRGVWESPASMDSSRFSMSFGE